MIKLLKKEIREIGLFIVNYYREIMVMGLASVFFLLNKYHPLEPVWLSALVYYFILPVISIVAFLRRNPLNFGLRIGNLRIWSFHVIITCIVAAPLLYFTSHFPSVSEYYRMQDFNLLKYSLEMIVYLFAWEYIFRGFMLFGLKEKLGMSSIVIQMIPFVLLHFGKPEAEVLLTIPVGIYFGYIAYRGNSFWPVFIIHLFINILFRVYVNIL